MRVASRCAMALIEPLKDSLPLTQQVQIEKVIMLFAPAADVSKQPMPCLLHLKLAAELQTPWYAMPVLKREFHMNEYIPSLVLV